MSTQLTDAGERSRSGLLSSGSPVRTALVVLLAYVVAGAVAGAVWEWVWTPPGQVIEQHQMFYDSYVSLRRVFTGTGLYVIVGGVASALVALGVCVLTRGRELLVLLLALVGSSLAAATMWWVGTRLGPSDPRPLVAHTVALTRVSGNLTVAGRSPYLVWPMLSLLVLALVYFGWPSSLTRHGAARDETTTLDRGPADEHSRADAAGLHRATELPSSQQRLVDELRSVRFTPTRLRGGYDMGAVDSLLDTAAAAAERGDAVAPLLESPLPTVSLREAYDKTEVDAFLARLRQTSDVPDAHG